jgi:HAE1 family hydrophobic/amphiphilic exporter-1
LEGKSVRFKLNLDTTKLQGYGYQSTSTTNYFSSNLDFPTEISNKRTKILIRLAGKYKNVDELRNLIVSSQNEFKFD